mgnify:CR=1 FL=1
MTTTFIVLATLLSAHAGPGQNKATEKVCKAGENITIDGRAKAVVLKGDCGTVTVTGTGNAVTIESVKQVVGKGTGHAIKYVKNNSGKEKLPSDMSGCNGCAVQRVNSL